MVNLAVSTKNGAKQLLTLAVISSRITPF